MTLFVPGWNGVSPGRVFLFRNPQIAVGTWLSNTRSSFLKDWARVPRTLLQAFCQLLELCITTMLEPLPLGIFGFMVFKGCIFELTPITSPRPAEIVELLFCNVLPMRDYLNQNIAGLDWFICLCHVHFEPMFPLGQVQQKVSSCDLLPSVLLWTTRI